jgi:hypothetical protein
LLLPRVGLEATASLVVAALDLKLVRLLRDAIRTADLAGGKLGPRAALPLIAEDRFLARRVIDPEPRFEPRPVIHPTPRFEPRPVIHPTVRVEPNVVVAAAPNCGHPKSCPGPLPPPWRQPVWEIPVPPRPVLKLVCYRPDMRHKGSLIDVFI